MSKRILIKTFVEILISFFFAYKLPWLFENSIVFTVVMLYLIVSVFYILRALYLSEDVALPHSGLNITELRNQQERYAQRIVRYYSLISLLVTFIILSSVYVMGPDTIKHITVFLGMFTFFKTLTLPLQVTALKKELQELKVKCL